VLRSQLAGSTDVSQARQRAEGMTDFLGGAPDARCEKVNADGVPAEWIAAPGFDPDRTVLYLHGGGYAIGQVRRLLDIFTGATSFESCVLRPTWVSYS